MVDYKKKYLKYKKKYLAIKKLKGGMLKLVWSALAEVPGKAVEVASTVTKSVTYEYSPPPATADPERESRYSGKAGKKTFNIFKSNTPTQFNARMANCEGVAHTALALLSPWGTGSHDLDRFVLIKQGEIDNLLPIDYSPKPGGAQIIEYTKNPDVDIYSDHEAICMPLFTGEPDNYKKLITMNLEGFCWPNGNGEDLCWKNKNQVRLNNVLDLLTPYISPDEGMGKGNIFLFQEVVLKGAADIERQQKESLIKFEYDLKALNSNYVLIDDGCTGAILYDTTEWELTTIINIDRRFLDYNNDVKGPGEAVKKKSNGYRFRNWNQPSYEMCVVNIHLKAMMSFPEFALANLDRESGPSADENQRLYEMANIYNIMKNHSGITDFEIPVYFGGDWNSQWEGGLYPCYTDVEHLIDIEKNGEVMNMRLYTKTAPLPPRNELVLQVVQKENLFISEEAAPPDEAVAEEAASADAATVPNNILGIIDMGGLGSQQPPQ